MGGSWAGPARHTWSPPCPPPLSPRPLRRCSCVRVCHGHMTLQEDGQCLATLRAPGRTGPRVSVVPAIQPCMASTPPDCAERAHGRRV